MLGLSISPAHTLYYADQPCSNSANTRHVFCYVSDHKKNNNFEQFQTRTLYIVLDTYIVRKCTTEWKGLTNKDKFKIGNQANLKTQITELYHYLAKFFDTKIYYIVLITVLDRNRK